MQLVKLHTTVQKPVDVVQNWSVQMYYTPTSSGRCGEAVSKAVLCERQHDQSESSLVNTSTR